LVSFEIKVLVQRGELLAGPVAVRARSASSLRATLGSLSLQSMIFAPRGSSGAIAPVFAPFVFDGGVHFDTVYQNQH